MLVYHGSSLKIENLDLSDIFARLADSNTALYQKPWREIYQLLLQELKKTD
jgi:FMN phosphatase YigB (HAD superfamily)